MQWRVHFGYSEVVIFVCGTSYAADFSCCLCTCNTLQPRDSSVNRGRREIDTRCCLFICGRNKFHVYKFRLKLPPSFSYCACASDSACINRRHHVSVEGSCRWEVNTKGMTGLPKHNYISKQQTVLLIPELPSTYRVGLSLLLRRLHTTARSVVSRQNNGVKQNLPYYRNVRLLCQKPVSYTHLTLPTS